MRSWSVGVLLFLAGTSADASSSGPYVTDTLDLARLNVVVVELIPEDSLKAKEPERLVAAGLAVLVGPFGAHRLYFGTKAKVPIIYGVTLGGFGVLVLIDLGHILFTKDLTPYRNNDQVLMWAKPKEAVTPP
ncbi:MAG: TM2 domain-containing protein [Flavobacteriales bacterium]|nr:TM2 domain-containing protein [Flavobacteriales bacterium]MBK9287495.1 TM2 domain-containing protein [Flavobacteriales bacterium]